VIIIKEYECKWCFEKHKIDNTGWVQTCKGYFPAFVQTLEENEIDELIKMQRNRR